MLFMHTQEKRGGVNGTTGLYSVISMDISQSASFSSVLSFATI